MYFHQVQSRQWFQFWTRPTNLCRSAQTSISRPGFVIHFIHLERDDDRSCRLCGGSSSVQSHLSVRDRANGVYLEPIPQYNLLMNMVTNIIQDVSQKAANECAYGFAARANYNSINGHQCLALSETFNMSALLSCILSNCKKYIPMFWFPDYNSASTPCPISWATLQIPWIVLTQSPTSM